MDVARPYSAVVPSLDGDVLVALAGVTSPLTGRQVAERAQRGSQSAVSSVLDRLVEHGLVLRQKAGRAHLHTLNRAHVAAPAVEALAKVRSNLFDRIGDQIATWPEAMRPANVTIFGSTARGDGDVRSDVDLFIVRPSSVREDEPTWERQIAELTDAVFLWTGNHAAIVQTSIDDLPEFVLVATDLVASLQSDGIDLAGTNLRSLLRTARQGV
jgi:predicted transcriptional regulator